MIVWKNFIPVGTAHTVDPSFDEQLEIDQFVKHLIAETTTPTTSIYPPKDHPLPTNYEF